MDFNEYQEKAMSTAIYPRGGNIPILYTALGLASEAGEVAGKVKKVLRDANGVFTEELKVKIMDEVSDVLWYSATLSKELGFTLEDVAIYNIAKLQSRKEAGTINGSGDNR